MTKTILRGKKASLEGRSTLKWLGRKMLIDESANGCLAMETTVLAEAFEEAVKVLGIDRDDPARLVVAKRIITFAEAGECDPVRLRELTVTAIRQEQRRPPTASSGLILIHP